MATKKTPAATSKTKAVPKSETKEVDLPEVTEETKAIPEVTPKKKAAPKQRPAELGELQDKIRRKTGLKSTLTGSIKKGRIVLQYSTREELEHLNDILDMLED